MAHKHDKCVCDQLAVLPLGTEVDIFLSGNTIEDVIFVNFNMENFCATFVDNETEPGTIIVLDCRDILALRIE
ncbi:penicillin-binding protein [Bacillus pseudomycoides]|uniref:penicillin-binding protein n=1 Tax=Bacillus pseudomycoides TaxID=64104 RepID=UPI000BEB8BB5|nr:penicillin-binding protein [Bacillus pseudomycoides]PEE36670.1 penicillin-binding protein [Bacillus pseudomycoides]PEI82899.1 penicillin-binding protein [Bacillus pseudomycoides]PGA85543.1 penicillin-binding protein [Bacillus pseudomycoides]PHF35130.1 penicillin-binding protein [Bacillus pseudomycoides]